MGRRPDFKIVFSRGHCQLVRLTDRPRPMRGKSPPWWTDPDPPEPFDDDDCFDPDPPDWAYWDDDDRPPEQDPCDDERRMRPAVPPGRGDDGQSSRSRNEMRRRFASLPWEMLGHRPALITLTYPGEWRFWVPDGRILEAHRRAFAERWRRHFGQSLVGVWVKEFQVSGRPHIHLYVALPDAISDADFEGLRQRTLLGQRLEAGHGRYEGRKKMPAIGQEYGGEFAMWLRDAWSGVVGTNGVVQAHHARGVDVRVMFWSDEAEAGADRVRVAEYLAREASKAQQKKPPTGFHGVGRYWGTFGRSRGFVPTTEELPLDYLVGLEIARRLERWVNWKLHVQRRGAPRKPGGLARRHPQDGITAFGMRPEQTMRVVEYSQAAAARKRGKGRVTAWGSGGAAPGEITKLANQAPGGRRTEGAAPGVAG